MRPVLLVAEFMTPLSNERGFCYGYANEMEILDEGSTNAIG